GPGQAVATSLDDLQAKAAAVHEALPWIKRLSGCTVVVKYGGAAMGTAGFDAFVDDVVLLRYVGVDVIVVHGGGPEVSQFMTRFGKEPVFVDGHRVPDAETMDLARMVLVGRVNKTLVGRINTHGRLAVGLSGEDGLLLVARPRVDPGGRDLGYVGDVAAVDPTALRALTDKGLVPVVATVAAGPGGQPYNVNADAAAGSLAGSLGAEKLVYLTDVEGLYADLDDPGSLLQQLTAAAIEAHLPRGEGTATGAPDESRDKGGSSLPEREAAVLWPTYVRPQVEFVRGQGVRLWDARGGEYLDFLGGVAVVAAGHAQPRVVEAVTAQLGTLGHTSNLYFTGPQVELAERLVGLFRGEPKVL